MTNAELNAQLEACETTTSIIFVTLQKTINAVMEGVRYLRSTKVHAPIENVQVAQTADRRHTEDNAGDITKRVKFKFPDLPKETPVSFSIGLIQQKDTSCSMTSQMHKDFDNGVG